MTALQFLGCPVDSHDDSTYNPEWGYNLVLAANSLNPKRLYTADDIWGKEITRTLWANVPKSAECDMLISFCESFVGRENMCILTTPTLDPESAAGKMEWIHEYMPEWLHRRFLIGACKEICATPATLLIDDSDANVNDFRKAGGQALLFPRPWNSAHGQGCLDHFLKTGGKIGDT